MVNYTEDFAAILEDFRSQGIETDGPGFYDDPQFTAVERRNPGYLNNYARFVQGNAYGPEYLRRAEAIIRTSAEELYAELEAVGRLGACIDASMVLSKILEREGVWNYAVKGALTIQFPRNSGLRPLHFWPIDNTDAQAGHVWLAAPPFAVVDVTISRQPFGQGASVYFPRYVLEKDGAPAMMLDEDVISSGLRAAAGGAGGGASLIGRISPDLLQFSRIFPPRLVTAGGVKLKYVPVAISAADRPLERITSLRLNGRFGINIYEDRIKPKLSEEARGS